MYIDALNFRKEDVIRVVQRIKGKRVITEHKPDYHFYVEDPRGTYTTIYGNTVKKVQPQNAEERNKLLRQFAGKKWESDVNPIMRCIEQDFKNSAAPDMHVAFFDIETDFDEVMGYSEPADALNPITSVAVYCQWLDAMLCLAVPPPTVPWEEAQKIANEVGETIVFKTEKEMLKVFLDIIEDADVLSGWNSEAYDIPYIVNRVIKTLGKNEARRFCLFDEKPKIRKFERGGKEQPTYDFIGRLHIDYMQLYKKYNYEERHSYSLNAIAEYELGEKKVEYSGTLDDLYKKDFKKFIQYNIQDTRLLDRLDKKLQFIDLCNTIAHGNHVLIPTTMGSVAMIDQAVVVEAHERNLIVPDKKRDSGDTRAAGGWVAQPKKGLHEWVGSSDLNSLYPSVIRALNMSPETIVAQVNLNSTLQTIDDWEKAAAPNTFANWWNDRFCPLEMENYFAKDNANKLDLTFESGERYVVTGAELDRLVKDTGQPWCISANGTIYRTDKVGVIPGLLTRWYSERKILQKQKNMYGSLEFNEKNEYPILIPDGIIDESKLDPNAGKASPFELDSAFKADKMKELIDSKDADAIVEYMNLHNLTVKQGQVCYRDKDRLKFIVGFWDKRQLVKKINLNSAYGALLNAGSRFFDQRIGQSTTLTGRNITKHMAAKTNEILTGSYDHYGECIIYGDTDSTYFSAWPAFKHEVQAGKLEWNKDVVIKLYDQLADDVSNTFPEFMKEAFNVPLEMSTGVIVAGREIVAETGLYIKKKRYAALVYDDEGTRKDVGGSPGKLKAMGLDLRRSDTPVFVQEFLKDILMATLQRKGEAHVIDKVAKFKEEFDAMAPWQKGSPKAVNRLTHYKEQEEYALAQKMKGKVVKMNMPGHVRASLNWNKLREMHNDRHTGKIVDAQKIIVCKLKEDATNVMSSIAYPVDEAHLPDWFTSLPFDEELMMETVVDKKVENLLGVLKWDLQQASKASVHFNNLFG